MAKILRERQVCERLGIGRTQLREKYIKTGRLRWIALGPHSKGALEEEVDALIAELARDRTPLPRPPIRKAAKPTKKTRKAA